MGRRLVILTGLLLLTGCQTMPAQLPGTVDQTDFHGLWGAYRACQAGMDLETAALAIRHLDRAPVRDITPPEFLPGPLKRVAEKPPIRLAADPRALAAVCLVHAGHLALAQGDSELAVEWFSLVIQRYPEADYITYVAQAWDGLLRTAPGITTASARPAAYIQ